MIYSIPFKHSYITKHMLSSPFYRWEKWGSARQAKIICLIHTAGKWICWDLNQESNPKLMFPHNYLSAYHQVGQRVNSDFFVNDLFCILTRAKRYLKPAPAGCLGDSVKVANFGFGHDLWFSEFEPHIWLSTVIVEPALHPLSPPSLCPSPVTLFLSLSKINKH